MRNQPYRRTPGMRGVFCEDGAGRWVMTNRSESCWLASGDDEAVVLDPDGFNLRWKLEFVAVDG